METFLIKAAQLVLAFAILVIIHEFGHFLFARVFGVKVERFYIFFNHWFSLFKWKPGKYHKAFSRNTPFDSESEDSGHSHISSEEKKSFWRNTEYGIGWLPLGGYCKIAGMIDESMDTKQLESEPKEWEFRSKPAWQRLLVMIAGVLFNFLLAIVIYAGIVYATGEKYVPLSEARMGMAFSKAAHEAGFRDGDIPVAADGKPLDEDPSGARMQILAAKTVTVKRGEATATVMLPSDFVFRLEKEVKDGDSPIMFMTYRIPAEVTQTAPGEGAAKGGILPGDRIIAVDSVATPDLMTFLSTLDGNAGRTVDITISRKREGVSSDTLRLPISLNQASKMGIGLQVDPAAFFKAREMRYSLLGSVPRGIELGIDKLTSYVSSMKLVFTKEGAQSIGGFGSIGSIFPERWDWIAFWNIAAFLSVALAFMNILPIPGLDGGHVIFLLYEVIFRRPPNQKFMEYATMAGLVLLVLLLLYANGMDIVRFFF